MMDSLFPFLFAQAWQVAVLAVVVWIVVKTCCKRRPHLAHALWLLVLIKCLVPPVFSSSTGVYSWILKEEKSFPTAIATGEMIKPPPMNAAEPIVLPGNPPANSFNRVAQLAPPVSSNVTPTSQPRFVQTPIQKSSRQGIHSTDRQCQTNRIGCLKLRRHRLPIWLENPRKEELLPSWPRFRAMSKHGRGETG